MQTSRKAFTLVELLVVIAILSVLLTLLAPALSRAREQARRCVCKANFHNIGFAYFTYGDANEGKMPPQMTHKTAGTSTPFWILEIMYEHMKMVGYQPKILVCPSIWANTTWTTGVGFTPGDFRYQDYFGGPDPEKDSDQELKYESWAPLGGWPEARLAGMFLLHGLQREGVEDSAQRFSDREDKLLAADQNMYWVPGMYWTSHCQEVQGLLLPEGANRLYLDGHVEWKNFTQQEARARNDTPWGEHETWW